MACAHLIVLCGAPCSGKTTLAAQLRESLGWPLFAKDAVKELLFDALGAADRAWSKRLSRASYDILFHAAEALLAAGGNCILEGNFRWSENEARFASLRRAAPQARCLQIFCDAPTQLLIARYRARVALGSRHEGHVDAAAAQEVEAELRDARAPLPIAGPMLTFDSSVNDPRAALVLISKVHVWAKNTASE